MTSAAEGTSAEDLIEIDDADVDVSTIDLRQRVLVVTGDTEIATGLRAHFERLGGIVTVLATAQSIHETVDAVTPEIIIVDEAITGMPAREVLLSLRSRGATFELPVVSISRDASVASLVHWLNAGAVDVWSWPLTLEPAERARGLTKECEVTSVQQTSVRPRLLAYARRSKMTGTLVTNEGTPFEGRATFSNGEFVEAQFGMLAGETAVDRMLELDDAPVRWLEDQSFGYSLVESLHRPNYRAKVLFVGIDEQAQPEVVRHLRNAGHRVDFVRGGAIGVQTALRTAYDVLILDFQAPHFDAWAVLREARFDLVARESAVIIMADREEVLETLKTSQSGAQAYFSHAAHARFINEAIDQLIAPRWRIWKLLTAKQTTQIPLSRIGTVWLMRTLGELDCTGRLVVEDAGKENFEVGVTQGQLVSVASKGGALTLRGSIAFEALIASRGTATFTFESIDVLERAPWLFDSLDTACEAIRRKERHQIRALATQINKLHVNEPLLPLFKQVATDEEWRVTNAMVQGAESLSALAAAAQIDPSEVSGPLLELIRWNVLSPDV